MLIADVCRRTDLQNRLRAIFLSSVDLDEDGVVTWEELEERLNEVRDADPAGHEARLKESQGQFMDKKVTSQQISGQPMAGV